MGFIVVGVVTVIGGVLIRRWNKRAAPDDPDGPIRAELVIALGLLGMGLGVAQMILQF